LCLDSKPCKGFLVLSDTLAAFAVPKNPRAKFFWLDDFTESEAHRYFDVFNYLDGPTTVENSCPAPERFSEITACREEEVSMNALREQIFPTISTRAVDLYIILKETRGDLGPSKNRCLS
jgi:hypothetical protein